MDVSDVQKSGSHLLAANSLHILAVDDDPRSTMLLERYLTKDGHSVRVEHSASAALEAFRAEKYDLVITDRAMPVMSGRGTASNSGVAAAVSSWRGASAAEMSRSSVRQIIPIH